ncbi:MAG TPA: hypothetical protein DEF00_04080 [Candidatus Taylorbacteria bacterium]|nr:MAG: hypothetical protein UY03_C0022G0015 [Parcubacteria group bacterium GW2011_GWA2_47_64]HBV01534.1 hypothetical protein [Candidatus Taylorbacteria bacterium]
MSEIDALRSLKQQWENHSKNEVRSIRSGKGEPVLLCYLQAGALIARLALIVGKRGGIREHLCVADLGNERVSEQLIILSEHYAATIREEARKERQTLLDLRKIRAQIKVGSDPVEVCQNALTEFIRNLQDGYELEEALRRLAINEVSPLFDRIVCGGAPGLRR